MTQFDPSKTYTESNPFVQNENPARRTPPRREPSPMRGTKTNSTIITRGPNGTKYSVYDEDFVSEIGSINAVDSHIVYIGNEARRVCNEAVKVATRDNDRLGARMILQRLRLAVEGQLREAGAKLDANPPPAILPREK